MFMTLLQPGWARRAQPVVAEAIYGWSTRSRTFQANRNEKIDPNSLTVSGIESVF
jgi:hypothetical protein